jgi:hypothetical protein
MEDLVVAIAMEDLVEAIAMEVLVADVLDLLIMGMPMPVGIRVLEQEMDGALVEAVVGELSNGSNENGSITRRSINII